ncbi:MAG: hypothetical protein Q8Q01_04715 [archaeon]|nr:hypothetical protein [archaeon]
MYEILLSLVGILIGVILARIAKEELILGKGYMLLFKNSLYSIISIITIYFLYQKSITIALIFLVITIFLFTFLLIKYSPYLEIGTYIIFMIPAIIIQNQNYILLVTSLLFLYGFPVGSLIWGKPIIYQN